MDFFEYANIALQFVNTDKWYVPFIVGGLCFLVVFVFQAVGLFVIAGREGYKNRWMAFVPFLNTYYIGVCGQKNRAFKGVDTRYLSIAAAVLELLLAIGYVVFYVAQFKLLDAGCIYEQIEEFYYGYSIPTYVLKDVPVELAWAAWCFECLDKYILTWVELIFLVLQVLVFSAFFQTFAARRYVLFTVTSVLFPIQGILIFILRNNTGMNYREFMRREQERQYRAYQQYSRQYYDNNPYNQNPYSRGGYNDPYGNNGYQNQNPQGGAGNGEANSPQDPFSEYGGGNSGGNGNNNSDPFDI
ncbi:MAG: hypothetical protein K2K80_00180 [Clostridia bacterium]|nr:hypothetical protein [Clostridia bacterium]